MPAIPGAFRVLVNTFIAFLLCCGWSQIDFLLFSLIAVLLFPAFFLCFPKFRCSKSFFFSVLYAEVFFFCFVLPCTVFVQRPDSQENVCMGIMSIGIVDGKISTHPHIYKVLLNKILKQRDIAAVIQFYRECNNEFSCKSAVLCFLCLFYGIPKMFPVFPFSRSHRRKHHLLIDQTMFPGIVMLDSVIIIVHPTAAHIGGSRNRRPSGSTADDLGFHVINCHRHAPFCEGVLSELGFYELLCFIQN